MSILVVLLPARPRGDAASIAASPGATTEYSYVLSADGMSVSGQGRATATMLPRADSLVALVADLDLGWHRVGVPRAPAARLRAALAGVLEEQLLDDPQQLHFALSPGAAPGGPGWVAVVHRAWLTGHLSQLENGGASIERVVPGSAPDEPPQGHFHAASDLSDGTHAQTWLTLSDGDGVQCVNLSGGLARALLPAWQAKGTQWSAAPAVAAQAERWLGVVLRVQSDAERSLQATRSLWNLRQFDLAARHRGLRALRDLVKRLRSPAWRPVRLGLASLLMLQVLGLNVWAWHQSRAIVDRQQAMTEILRSSHPSVRAVLDAPVQMRRETELLRAAAGQTGDGDLEALMAAAARAWPPGQAPAQSIRFEPGRLVLAAAGWSAGQVGEFGARLRAGGWQVEQVDGRLTITRLPAAQGAGA